MALVAGGGSCWDVGGREKDGWAFVLSHRIIIIITLHKLAARRNSISIFFALSSFRVWGRGTDFCSNFLPSIHLLTAQPAVAPPSNNILLGEEQEGGAWVGRALQPGGDDSGGVRPKIRVSHRSSVLFF